MSCLGRLGLPTRSVLARDHQSPLGHKAELSRSGASATSPLAATFHRNGRFSLASKSTLQFGEELQLQKWPGLESLSQGSPSNQGPPSFRKMFPPQATPPQKTRRVGWINSKNCILWWYIPVPMPCLDPYQALAAVSVPARKDGEALLVGLAGRSHARESAVRESIASKTIYVHMCIFHKNKQISCCSVILIFDKQQSTRDYWLFNLRMPTTHPGRCKNVGCS